MSDKEIRILVNQIFNRYAKKQKLLPDEFYDELMQTLKAIQVEAKVKVQIADIRPVRFYCQECGKELFDMIDFTEYTISIKEFLNTSKQCSDCELKSIQSNLST